MCTDTTGNDLFIRRVEAKCVESKASIEKFLPI